jgi:hypothetical protein
MVYEDLDVVVDEDDDVDEDEDDDDELSFPISRGQSPVKLLSLSSLIDLVIAVNRTMAKTIKIITCSVIVALSDKIPALFRVIIKIPDAKNAKMDLRINNQY